LCSVCIVFHRVTSVGQSWLSLEIEKCLFLLYAYFVYGLCENLFLSWRLFDSFLFFDLDLFLINV